MHLRTCMHAAATAYAAAAAYKEGEDDEQVHPQYALEILE